MKKKTYEIICTHLDSQGKGVFTLFKKNYALKNLLPNEKAIISIDSNDSIQLIKIISNSSTRVTPRCKNFENCGGCQLLHMDADYQKQFKTNIYKETFKPLKTMIKCPIHNCVMQEDPWYYRNKVQMPIVQNKNQLMIGFYQENSIQVIEQDDCFIQTVLATKVLEVLRSFIKKYRISGFNWKTKRGCLKYILIRHGFATDELMVVLVTNGSEFKYHREFVQTMTKQIPQIKTIVQNINRRKDHLVLDKEQRIWFGKGYIADCIGDVRFLISPRSFYQINPPQVKKLYDCILQYANLTGKEIVIDAYCGVGTIGLYLARQAKKVYGVEFVDDAIEDAKKNARLNKIENAFFQVGDASKYMVKLARNKMKVDVVIVDPPRAGCTKELIDSVLQLSPKRFIYVSCNIETQKRDLELLKNSPYQITDMQAFDLFPQTTHIESVILLQKVK